MRPESVLLSDGKKHDLQHVEPTQETVLQQINGNRD